LRISQFRRHAQVPPAPSRPWRAARVTDDSRTNGLQGGPAR
jgi:hypothetical protein